MSKKSKTIEKITTDNLELKKTLWASPRNVETSP